MQYTWATASEHDLLDELDTIERAIGRSSTFNRWTDQDGRTHVRVSPELLALAQREHLIVSELRRRRQLRLAA